MSDDQRPTTLDRLTIVAGNLRDQLKQLDQIVLEIAAEERTTFTEIVRAARQRKATKEGDTQ
jgi:hypothetical protein